MLIFITFLISYYYKISFTMGITKQQTNKKQQTNHKQTKNKTTKTPKILTLQSHAGFRSLLPRTSNSEIYSLLSSVKIASPEL